MISKVIRILLVVHLVCSSLAFAQTPRFLAPWELENPPVPILTRVKSVEKYISLPGVAKMRPYELRLVANYDAKGRLEKDISYSYSESIFGKDTTIVIQDYSYFGESDKVWVYKKHHRKVVYHQQYYEASGIEFDINGNRLNYLIFNSAGGIDTVSIKYLQDSVIQANSHSTYRNDSPKAFDGLDPNKIAKDSMAGRSVSAVMGSVRLMIPKIAQGDVFYEPTADGYVLKEVAEDGQVLAEQRVIANENLQPLQVINATDGYNNVTIFDYLYDEEGRQVKLVIKDKKGKVIKQYENTFNNTGHLLTSVVSGKRGKIISKTKYEYELY